MEPALNLSISNKLSALEEINQIIKDAIGFVKNGKVYYDRVLASTLYTLLINDRSNTPLLIEVAQEINYKITLQDDTPQGIKSYSLEEFMSYQKWGSGVHQEQLTNTEFIKHFRDKRSISHQDPNMTSEMLHSSSADGWNLGGLPAETYSLLNIAQFILPSIDQVIATAKGGI